MRNVFQVLHYYLDSEPGDPLAAGLSQQAVGICTVGHISYMTVQMSLDVH